MMCVYIHTHVYLYKYYNTIYIYIYIYNIVIYIYIYVHEHFGWISSSLQVNMLNTQYRMHPDISKFPSANFYEGIWA